MSTITLTTEAKGGFTVECLEHNFLRWSPDRATAENNRDEHAKKCNGESA